MAEDKVLWMGLASGSRLTKEVRRFERAGRLFNLVESVTSAWLFRAHAWD